VNAQWERNRFRTTSVNSVLARVVCQTSTNLYLCQHKTGQHIDNGYIQVLKMTP